MKTNSSTESAQKAQTAKFAILQTKKKFLNPGAKEYIPKKKTKQQVPEKLNFNLEAKEFVQKQTRKKMKMMMKKTKSNLI